MNFESIIEKYEKGVLKKINKENMTKIIHFLEQKNCDFIDDMIEDYLDLFSFDYNEFVTKYEKLDKKYNYQFLNLASEDMNKLEEFYQI